MGRFGFRVETSYNERPFFGGAVNAEISGFEFLGAAALFFTATIAAGIYGLDAARLNLWLALGLVLALNPLGLGGQKLTAWGLCAGIAALAAVMLPARIWGVWLFAAFMAAGGMLKGFYPLADDNTNNEAAIPYGRLIILTAAYFNLSFITNTGHTDVQYDFASCYNYIEYILENDFLFWRENPLLTRPSYSTYHPILHFLLAAGEMRLATVLGAGMLNAGIGADVGDGAAMLAAGADALAAGMPEMGTGANMQPAAEAAQVCFCFYMLWYYFLAGKILRFFRLRTAVYYGALAFVCFFPAYNAIAGFSTTTACCCRYRLERFITPCSITVMAGGKIWRLSCCLPPRRR